LGLLEKKKDYQLRAKDYNKKQKRLAALRQKAFFKNNDEFYFAMEKKQTKGGVHIAERNKTFTNDEMKLLRTQDQGYVNYQRSINLSKIEKLKSSMHIVDNESDSVKHTIFVDDEEQVETFDPATHFNTLPELVDRKFNRPINL
jgi:U3 small nucleolar RNA-associated protein 11